MNCGRIFSHGLLLFLLFGFFTPIFSQEAEYNITRIDSIIPSYWQSLNDSTVLLGNGDGPYEGKVMTWRNDSITVINMPDQYVNIWAYCINNEGMIVGFAAKTDYKYYVPFKWDKGTLTELTTGLLEPYEDALAYGVNNHGIIVGRIWIMDPDSQYQFKPFVYNQGMSIWNFAGSATAINDSNCIIGYKEGSAFLYDKGNMIILGDLIGPVHINNRNQIVGYKYRSAERTDYNAFLYENGNQYIMEDSCTAFSINDNGIIVGTKYNRKAVKWVDRVMIDLNTCIPNGCNIFLGSASDINNRGEIICGGIEGGSSTQHYYLLTPNKEIIKPRKDNTWLSGEKDSIQWYNVWEGKTLKIEYSADSGSSWTTIVSGVPADSCKYVWDIPKDILSTKCFIRLLDDGTNYTLVVSEMFKIKPYIITRIDDNGDYAAYNIAKDRWGFGNYPNDMWPPTWYRQFDYHGIDPFTNILYPADVPLIGANSSDYVDWPSYVRAYGSGTCYWNINNATYNQMALLHWASEKSKWGGSCFAIAVSNALAFEKTGEFVNKFSDFPFFDIPINVTSDYDVIKSMAELYAQVGGNPTRKHYIENWLKKTPNQTLNELKEILKTDVTKIQTLTFWNLDNTGAHTILPYKVEKSTIVNTNWLIWVWDNAVPNDATAFVYIDTSANNNNGTWYYSNFPKWGGPGKLILDLECSTYLGTPTLPKGLWKYSPFVLSDTVLQVMTSYNNDIQIEDNQGYISGYADSILSYDIPGSVPLIIPTGKETPPYGYNLKKDSYSITLDNFTADTIDNYMFTGNEAFSYSRYGVLNTETDRLSFNEGISVTNPDAQKKNIRLMNLVNDTTNEKMAVVSSLGLSQNDSVKLENLDGSKYRLTSFGVEKSYLLELKHTSETGLVRFIKSGVPLGSNTTHTIEPNWIDLDSSILPILVDVGNDGTIDDMLRLQNDLTDIQDHGSLIPDEYKLYQNYPNPFNPATIIRYTLPEDTKIMLSVYNMLGQRIAVLVDDKQDAGFHEVTFDASKLTSGMYFYRLQAGNFTSVQKMLLVK